MIGILITNQNGEILEANDYILNVLGYTQEDLKQGKLNWVQLTPLEYREKSREIAARLVKNISSIETFEKEYIHKNGNRLHMMVSGSCYKEGTFLTLLLNMTEQKKY